MRKKLYVGNLSFETTETELKELFTQSGLVETVRIITDRDTGRSKGFGFVEMGDDAQAKTAINAMNGQQFDGRALTVNEAKPMEPRAPRSGGGGYGGGGYGGGGGGYGGGGGGRNSY